MNTLAYLKIFLLSGLTVTGITFLGNQYNPALGGILSGIPISIPSLLLINEISNQKKFMNSANMMVMLLCFTTFICWYLFNIVDISSKKAVIISSFCWIIGALVYYFIFIS